MTDRPARIRHVAESEEAFQQAVVDLAGACGWWVHHHFDSKRSEPGWPDLVLLRPPEAVFVEVKAQTGRIRPAQRVVLEMLSGCGLETHIWRPADWPAIVDRLGRRSREGATSAR